MKTGSARRRQFMIGNEDPKAFQVLSVVPLRSLRPLIDVTHHEQSILDMRETGLGIMTKDDRSQGFKQRSMSLPSDHHKSHV